MKNLAIAVDATRATELHERVLAHAKSRVEVSRELSRLGRRFRETACERFASNEERLKESAERIERLEQVRAGTQRRVHETFTRL